MVYPLHLQVLGEAATVCLPHLLALVFAVVLACHHLHLLILGVADLTHL